MDRMIDMALSGAATILLQSTCILGLSLAVALGILRSPAARYPVLLSGLVITLVSAGWAVWNPGRVEGIRIGERVATKVSAGREEVAPLGLPPAPAFEGGLDRRAESGERNPERVTSGSVAVAPPVFHDEALPPAPIQEPELEEAGSAGSGLAWRSVGVTILVVWLGGSLFLALRLLVGCLSVRRLVREAELLPEPVSRRAWREAAAAIGVADLPPCEMRSSPRVGAPVVVGFRNPCIVLPETMRGEAASPQLRAVLAHEMAHILRRDTLAGLLERGAEVLLWPQPLLRLFLRAMDRAREEICDNYALAVSERHHYGRILLSLSERRGGLQDRGVAMGILQDGWNLERRIADILNPKRNTMTQSALKNWIAPTVAIATVALTLGGTRITFAQEEERREEREREARADGERFEAQVRELKAAMREAAERGQEDRAHQLELRLKDLLEAREHQAREREARANREREARGDGERFEAQVRELQAAIHEASERGQRERAHELELRLREVLAARENQAREREARANHERAARADGERFEAQVRELKAAMREAAERGQEDRAHQLELRLKDLLEAREHQAREREAHANREREARGDGERFEAEVRELQAAIHEAAERGQRERAHELELRLREVLAARENQMREREARAREGRGEAEQFENRVRELESAIHEAAERGQRDRAHELEVRLERVRVERERQMHEREGHAEGESRERAAQLEGRMREMAQRMEEMQRAMQEMRRELERLRGGEGH